MELLAQKGTRRTLSKRRPWSDARQAWSEVLGDINIGQLTAASCWLSLLGQGQEAGASH